MCSTVLPFCTVRVCWPDVLPASPVTWSVTPPSLTTETKCTLLFFAAARAALYSDEALLDGVLAAPAGTTPAPRVPSAARAAVAAARPAAAAATRTETRRDMEFTLLGARVRRHGRRRSVPSRG